MEELVLKIQQGHSELYMDLWEAVKNLVAWWAIRYYRAILRSGTALGGLEKDDLVQAGFLSLVDAVNGYDPSKGAFTTYLAFHIKKEFRRAIGRSDRQLRDPLNDALSLDVPMSDDDPEGPTKLDFVADPQDQIENAAERVFLSQLHTALEEALDTLPARQAAAIRSEYFDGCTLEETAKRMGSTKESVRQLRENGFKNIRNSSAGKKLEQFLDENTSFYKGMGLKSFNQTKTSGVEQWVIRREQMRKTYESLIR